MVGYSDVMVGNERNPNPGDDGKTVVCHGASGIGANEKLARRGASMCFE